MEVGLHGLARPLRVLSGCTTRGITLRNTLALLLISKCFSVALPFGGQWEEHFPLKEKRGIMIAAAWRGVVSPLSHYYSRPLVRDRNYVTQMGVGESRDVSTIRDLYLGSVNSHYFHENLLCRMTPRLASADVHPRASLHTRTGTASIALARLRVLPFLQSLACYFLLYKRKRLPSR